MTGDYVLPCGCRYNPAGWLIRPCSKHRPGNEKR